MTEIETELEELVAAVRSAVSQGRPPWFDPEAGETVLMPESEGRGYWVGAPSLVVDDARQRVLLSYRRRRPRDGSSDERGYLAAIAESTDGGRSFTDVWRLTKHEVGTSSLERFCLRPTRGQWLLYTSWEDPPSSGRWRIDLLRAATPEDFSLSTAVPVLAPDQVGVDAVKDPYVVERDGEVLMYVSTFLTPDGPAPTSLATSTDGTHFAWQGKVLGVGAGWDAYQARISSLVPFGAGFVAYYDGARSPADDTEEHCGLAVSTDLRSWRRVTTGGPALVSPYATGSLRYVEPLQLAASSWVYYEYTRPDGSHELRRNRLLP
jgi:hypothetical protein